MEDKHNHGVILLMLHGSLSFLLDLDREEKNLLSSVVTAVAFCQVSRKMIK